MNLIRGTALAVAAAMLWLGGTAHAAYPDKPITLLVGFSAGGNLDILARTLQPFLEKELGGKVVVQNMPGANSAVMYQHLSQQKPDGYTAAINSAPSLLAPLVASDRRYTVDSFVYVATLTDEPYTLFVNHKTPRLQQFATTKEFIDYAKDNPGKVLISGTEIGSAPHITSLMITRATGAKFTWVPFNGSAPAVAALEGGHVDATISSISMGVKLHKEDRMRTLAVLQDKRLPEAPDIPGFAELGWTVRASTNRGVQMPAGTPPEIIAMWDAAVAKIHKDPEFLKQAEQRSMALSYIGHAEYTQYIKQEADAYAAMWAADPWLKK